MNCTKSLLIHTLHIQILYVVILWQESIESANTTIEDDDVKGKESLILIYLLTLSSVLQSSYNAQQEQHLPSLCPCLAVISSD